MALLLLVWVGVAALLAAYAEIHHPSGRTLFTLGFTGLLQMKAWLTTAAVAFVIVQLVTALWMWGDFQVQGRPHHGLPYCTGGRVPLHSFLPFRWSLTAYGRLALSRPVCVSSSMALPVAYSMERMPPK